mmetsp:Transcript_58840/g.164332  ORF Transcript_58840/g.164332 Transcript_58840/m.164332 type:complete len:202 (-) Transcript_58840:383-988(-)
MRARQSCADRISPEPPSGSTAGGKCRFSTACRVASSTPSKYLSASKCVGDGKGASAPSAFSVARAPSSQRSTQFNASGAQGSSNCPNPIDSNNFCAAKLEQPRASAALNAAISADAKVRVNSKAATASRKAASWFPSFSATLARLESKKAARLVKSSLPKSSPRQCFSASTPAFRASCAPCHCSASMAPSLLRLASSASAK